MKKIYSSLLLTTLAATALVSCESEKEFLTEKPKAMFTIDNAYQTSAQVLSTVVSAYATIQEQNYGKNASLSSDQMSLFSVFGAQANSLPTWANTGTWANGGPDADNTNALIVWNEMYQVAAKANQALYACSLPSITWSSEAEKAALTAEAKFLKGFAYLRLAEYFGGVPIVDEYSEELRFDYERASREDTYKYAIDNLKAGYDALPAKPTVGRAGKGAAALLLSEAYLGMGVATNNASNYSTAATYAKECIELHPLMTKRFGVRADASDTGSNLGVPNYNPDGTPYSDLFYKQNPRLAENTEGVWVFLGAKSYEEQQANNGVVRTMSHRNYAPANRDVRALRADLQEGSGEKPWNDGKFDPLYQVVNGKSTSIPAITANGVPFAGTPSWYAAEQVWGAELNKAADKDDRGKEGVAIRRKYPVTNPDHPYYKKCVQKAWGTDPSWIGFAELSKDNMATTMEYSAVFDKRTPVDAWGYDENTYFSASVFGANIFRDWYMLRSAEAYLLLAEAEFRSGNADAAAEAINALRVRANAVPFEASDVTLNSILDERTRELMHEEDRWGTLLRMEPDVWKDRIYSYGTWTYNPGLAKANANAKLWPETMQFEATSMNPIAWDLWPIPKQYVDLNSDNAEGMKQNKGWE